MRKIIAFILLLCIVFTFCACKEKDIFLDRYVQAEEMYNSGNYMEAAKIYKDLRYSEYKDSEEKFMACYYNEGIPLLAQKDYRSALEKFEECRLYQDTPELIAQCEAEISYALILERLGEQTFSEKIDLQLVSQSSYLWMRFQDGEEHLKPKVEFSSDGFQNLSDAQKLSVFDIIANTSIFRQDATIFSGSDVYGSYGEYAVYYLTKNEKVIYEEARYASNSSTSSKGCPACNGTGYVRYYSAGSDLESYLAGLDPYTTGKCSMCDGTGR